MRQRIVNAAMRPEFWLLSLLLWLLLSAGRSLGTPWARVALTEVLRWSGGIGLALALGFFRPIKTAMVFCVFLVGVLAMLGIGDGVQTQQGGLAGPYLEHQLYGSVLLILLPPVVAATLTLRDHRWRLAAGATASSGTLCLFLSQTRSAWIGAAAATLVFGGLWLFSVCRQRDRRSVCFSAAVLAGAALTVWLLTAPTSLSTPLTARVGTLSTLGNDGSWQERLTLWRGAARLVAAHPLSGIGLGRYPGVQWAWTRAGDPLRPTDRPTLSEEAHDFYLQTAAEIGLIGLGLYGAALTAFVFQGLRYLRRTYRPRSASREALVIASLSLLAGQAVDAVASPSWQFAEASLFFWALLGIGLAALRGEEPVPIAVHNSPTLRRACRFVLAGGLAVIVIANLLPIGLLTPVEAYTPSTGWTYVQSSLTMTGPSTLTAGTQATYTLTATYTDGQGHTQMVDVSLDPVSPMTGTPSYYGSSSINSPFGPAGSATRNVLTASSSDKGKTLTLLGSFYDKVTGVKHAPCTVKIN